MATCRSVGVNRARIFKLLRTQGIDSMESIPYNLSRIFVVMEQVTPQQCLLNVIYIRVLRGHCSIYSMSEGKYLVRIIPTESFSRSFRMQRFQTVFFSVYVIFLFVLHFFNKGLVCSSLERDVKGKVLRSRLDGSGFGRVKCPSFYICAVSCSDF